MKPDPTHPMRAAEALATLLAGNARFASGTLEHPRQDPARREALLGGQRPIAAILGCADSRIVPETIFDCGLGDLFVVRLAGNTPDDFGLASLAYAVEHLGVPLVLVLGHSQCGAITAAASGEPLGGHLEGLGEALRPAIEEARREARDGAASGAGATVGATVGGGAAESLVDRAARWNARRTAAELRAFLGGAPDGAAEALGADRALFLAAYYDQADGRVKILDR